MATRTTLIGLAVALIGASIVALFVARAPRAASSPGETVPAFVVTARLPANLPAAQLAPHVRQARVPIPIAPERRVTDLADLDGQLVLRPVGVGEVLTLDQFGAPGPAAGGLVVPSGYEAIAVEAEPAPGVEGYVTPRSRVNVYGVLGKQAEPGAAGVAGAYTQLVLGHVDVLAVTRGTMTGESAQPEEEAPATNRVVLLLQVRPEDAPVLIHAQSRGQLWFTLVNSDDPPPGAVRVTDEHLGPDLRSAAINQAAAARAAAPVAAEQARAAEGQQ